MFEFNFQHCDSASRMALILSPYIEVPVSGTKEVMELVADGSSRSFHQEILGKRALVVMESASI